MKKKTNKDLILFVLVVPVFLFLAFYISNRMEKSNPAYSVVNKSKMGYSVFYEALKQLNYPVEKALVPVNEYPNNSVQIMPPGGNFNINNQEVKQWLENGGTLVYLTTESDQNIGYGAPVETKNNIKQYTYLKGRIINADADFMTNKTLIKDTDYAYELLKEISNLPYEKIYFNESYLFLSTSTKSLWDITPIEIKYIIYQMIISLAAFFYYKSKGFGKKLPLYEEVERSENEYLYSAASLYRQAKCYDLMVDNYYKNFLKGFVGNSEEWLEYWEKEKIPSLNQARSVYEFMKYKKTKPRQKEYIKIVTMIEHLNNILDKRSDTNWKTLKKTLHENL
ncbi:DUF4350 domain-containing protein [Clostridium estertheticum]|uniref:DUF4350 domain-containing protein n=1 Tax=Clostridium estertheticum TaxID=238834 RepID=UPI0013E944CC|nr:DUF4350 domain-containing protein [Clostridium estertheticum]MBZ9687227.1 DUF4350 domain-containing protein [Clostridium estertheticum]